MSLTKNFFYTFPRNIDFDLLKKEQEEQEYYTVIFKKERSDLYTSNPDQPLLKLIRGNMNIVEGKAIFTEFEMQHLKELLKLENANIIIL
jgi:hypothetical protein